MADVLPVQAVQLGDPVARLVLAESGDRSARAYDCRIPAPTIEVRRVYDDPTGTRGEYRVLVDRLWPRGMSKDALGVDEWAKDVAPSTALRRWYGHVPERFGEFASRYRAELRQPQVAEAVEAVLRAARRRPTLVLLTATKDVDRSGAKVLASHLRRRRAR